MEALGTSQAKQNFIDAYLAWITAQHGTSDYKLKEDLFQDYAKARDIWVAINRGYYL